MQRTLPLDCSLLPRSVSYSCCTMPRMLTTAVAIYFDLPVVLLPSFESTS